MRAIAPNMMPIERTLERVLGTNGVLNFSRTSQGHLQFEYDGNGMDVDWDTAEPVNRECDDKVFRTVFLDNAGNEWTSDQITLVDDEATP